MFSPRKQEMFNKLPPAPKTMLQHSADLCAQAGIALSEEDFYLLHRIVTDYLTKSPEAKKWVVAEILKATVTPATYTKQYYLEGHVGDEEKQLDYRELTEFKGWIYKGRSGPYTAIDIYDKVDLEACEMCGGLFPRNHCVVTATTMNGGKEHLENMCNHCRLMYDSPKVRDTASHKTCETCVMTSCRYHPSLRALVAPERPSAQQVAPDRNNLTSRYSSI